MVHISTRFFFMLSFILVGLVGHVFAQSVLNSATEGEIVYSLSPLHKETTLQQLRTVPKNAAFLAEFDSLYGEWYQTPILYNKLLTDNIDDWEIALFEARNQQLKFLAEAENSAVIPSELASHVKKSILWNYWHLVLAYPILRSNNDTKFKRVVSLPRIMTDELDLTTINQPDDLMLDTYRKFLPLAVTYFNSQEKGFTKYADRTKLVKDKVEFAAKYLKGDLLDFYQTVLIEENCPYLTPASAKYFISNVYSQPFQQHLLTICDETLNRKEVVEKTQETKGKLTGNLPKLMDLADKPFDFSEYKGKVIYVDFWASWCGPCRQEFPKSREMHESLSKNEKEQIVFLYISVDESLEAWKNAVKQLGLEEFGENGHSYEVSGRYNIRTIPRYMIINQQGEIVEMEATRPSNPETLQQLLKLIEK